MNRDQVLDDALLALAPVVEFLRAFRMNAQMPIQVNPLVLQAALEYAKTCALLVIAGNGTPVPAQLLDAVHGGPALTAQPEPPPQPRPNGLVLPS